MLDVTESIKNGYTYKADGNRDHKYKVTRIESISSGVINLEKLGSSDEINKDYKLIDGDILFSHINSLSHIGNTAMYTTDLGNIYHGMNLLNIRAKQDIVNSHFLLCLLKKDSSRNWFRIIAKPAVNQASISVADVGSFEFLMPNIAEQQKIGEYFSNLDHLITLHQRKCEQTNELKKFMLQKMFPKKGEKNPEIRFPGFTDDWEQRKLEKHIIEYHEVTTENNQYPVLTSSRKGIFLQTDYYSGNQVASADNTGYNIVPYGYFTYRHMSDDEIFHFNINDIVENGIVSTLYPVFTTDEKLDSRYLQYQLNYGSEFARFAVLQKQGGSRTYMYLNKLKKLSLTMPTSIDEQKKISSFLMSLDNLITLHQRKVFYTLKHIFYRCCDTLLSGGL